MIPADFSDHLSRRYHCGQPAVWTHRSSIASPRCGDELTLYVVIERGRLNEAWNSGQGCIICQAAASFICEWAEQQSINLLAATSETQFLALLCPLTPMRQQCALLPFRCLKQLLKRASDGISDHGVGEESSSDT